MKKVISLNIFRLSILALTSSVFIGCGETSGNDCCDEKVSSFVDTQQNKASDNIEKIPNKKKELGIVEEQEPDNLPPKAVVNGNLDLIKIENCEIVSFIGSASNDSDGTIVSYEWKDSDNKVLSQNPDFNRQFCSSGVYEKTLTVVDDKNAIGIARVCILVNLDEEDIPLSANAGEDKYILEGESVTFTGRAECRSDELSYRWTEEDNTISKQASFTKNDFSVGTHILTLEVSDVTKSYSHHTVTLTVNPK
jgi:hypothetical protein